MDNPFVAEMNGGDKDALNEFIWDSDLERVENRFFMLAAEV